ncbi:MAG: hypothetical protein NXI00_01570 [Cytophagales bacterium]|nr:hypothetical protein [Cytophagales bacterium]
MEPKKNFSTGVVIGLLLGIVIGMLTSNFFKSESVYQMTDSKNRFLYNKKTGEVFRVSASGVKKLEFSNP